MELKKISKIKWKIPRTGSMKVPAIIYASEKLLKDIKGDKSLEQIKNVASLPGIYKHAIALPDMHCGYGFPIGGVAALDFNKGGLSPGGIGYDINCLTSDTKILTEFGYFREIKDFENLFTESEIESNGLKTKIVLSKIKVPSLNENKFESKELLMFMKKKSNKKILKIRTETGFEVKVSEDHPILTNKGMVESKKLIKDNLIAVNTFEGVEYEKTTNEDKKAILSKILGYLFGDGLVYFSGRKAFVCAYGKEKDLEKLKEDIGRLGYKAYIYSRKRNHKIITQYGIKEFKSNTSELRVNSKELANELIDLGMPLGNKTNLDYRVPGWIKKSKKWIKRLFLAGFFGAELSKPSTHSKTGFYSPVVSQNNKGKVIGRKFMVDLIDLLEEFNVKVNKISTRKEFRDSYRTRLIISARESNLLKLWRNIGFEYNEKRSCLANIASFYILKKKRVTKIRKDIAQKIKELKKKGLSLKEVQELFCNDIINNRFIERHYYEKAGQRLPLNFISFNDFKDEFGGLLYDKIEIIEEIEYDGYIYDFNVKDNHNFVANGIIVSNCGVRMLQTNLTRDDVLGKVHELLEEMYKAVPAGLGSKSDIKLMNEDLDIVLEQGAKWAVSKGYGSKQDLENCEEHGGMKGADASKVSKEAKVRGKNQLDTLGSGNHFLEVQYVDKIFDKKIAKTFGIEKEGQVTIMIHCGSRGLGHKVCTDYLREMERAYPDLIKSLPDRELVYAPAGSKLCKDYFGAMAASANFAWCNRHVIASKVRDVFVKMFKCKVETVYDVAHNMAKIEEHVIDGSKVKVYMHRKGATRAFGPGSKDLPQSYRDVGQPIIIPGSMGTASYLLVGTAKGMLETFGSTAHGAGRIMSRVQAKKQFWGETVKKELEKDKIYIKGHSLKGVSEEAPGAYKDIEEVVKVSHEAGIGNLVARVRPIAVVKG